MKGALSGTLSNRYDMTTSGEDIAPSITLALLYRPIPRFNLTFTGTTETKFTLKGSMNAQIQSSEAINGEITLETILPYELHAGGIYSWENGWSLQGGVRKKWWSRFKEQDIDVNHPLLEAKFGKPSARNWNDTITANASLSYRTATYQSQIGASVSTGLNKPDSGSIVQPSYGSKTLFCKGSLKAGEGVWIGAKLSHSFYTSGEVNSPTMIGVIKPGDKTQIGIFSSIIF